MYLCVRRDQKIGKQQVSEIQTSVNDRHVWISDIYCTYLSDLICIHPPKPLAFDETDQSHLLHFT